MKKLILVVLACMLVSCGPITVDSNLPLLPQGTYTIDGNRIEIVATSFDSNLSKVYVVLPADPDDDGKFNLFSASPNNVTYVYDSQEEDYVIVENFAVEMHLKPNQ